MRRFRTVWLAAVLAASAFGAAAHGETTIVAFGDSTTAPRGKLKVYAQILREELPKRGVPAKVVNAGVGGNTTDMARRRFEKDVLAENPDLVVVQFGINDSAVDVWRRPPAAEPRVARERYESNLRHFARELKAIGARVILMTPNPLRWTPKLKEMYGKPPYDPGDPDGFNALLRDYAETVRTVAREEGLPLVDAYAAFQSYAEREGQSVDDLLSDGMHPNGAGHRLIAEMLAGEIAGPAPDDP